jgi:hypothetical protein
MRNLKFALDVETNALLCPNPQEFYSKSYITENVVDNFRTVPGVKESTKLAKNTFDNVIKAESCTWSAVDSILDAVDITVCKVNVMTQICQYDLESSFVSLQMAKGDANYEVASFMTQYWADLSAEVEAEIQDIRWNGNTSLTGATYLKECDGYLKKIDASTAVTKTTGATITAANIVSAITIAVTGLPEAVKGKKQDARIYMSAKNALLYSIATLGLNNNFNYTGELPLAFAGFKIAVQESMSDSFVIASNKNNMVYAFDGEGDSKAVKAVNLIDTVAEPVIRTRLGLKMGFHLLNENEISIYKAV